MNYDTFSLIMLRLCLHSDILTTSLTLESWLPKCAVQLNE